MLEKKKKVMYAIFAIFVIWTIGGIAYHFLENWNWLDSFYFAANTITTVGYGDRFPTQPLSKVFTIIYLFTGISVVLYSLTVVGRYYIDQEFKKSMTYVNHHSDRLIKK